MIWTSDFRNLVELERVTIAAAVRAFEQRVETKMLTIRHGLGDSKSLRGHRIRAGEFEKGRPNFFSSSGGCISRNCWDRRGEGGGRERVGHRQSLSCVPSVASYPRGKHQVLSKRDYDGKRGE